MSKNRNVRVARDRMEFGGVVTDSCHGIFKVQLESGSTVQCRISGRIRTNNIHILVGDRVEVELSEADPSQGRITYRGQ